MVTGGAGYIGAHIVEALLHDNRQVVVVDDLSTGFRERIAGVPLVQLDVAAPTIVTPLRQVMTEHGVDAVVHLAARKRVDESMARPLYYYQQNIGGLQNVIEAMTQTGVRRLVFSSSAAVYGETDAEQVSESHPTLPVNPYGRSKLVGEWLCRDIARIGAIDAVSLRYFNVAGAGRPELGDPTVMNLATMVIDRLRRGLAPAIYGDDYPTPDGTCVRDFIHVTDLADAHRAALGALEGGLITGYEVFNVGTGKGASVRDVIEELIALSGRTVEPSVEPRRAGDPASVVASADRIHHRLGWVAQSDLPAILSTAWEAGAP